MSKPGDRKAKSEALADRHADGTTRRPATPALEGRTPLPEELTGRASGTSEDLVALMGNASADHLADGFRGGTDDESVADNDATGDVAQYDADDPLDGSEQ
jgi:hypothetical protein